MTGEESISDSERYMRNGADVCVGRGEKDGDSENYSGTVIL